MPRMSTLARCAVALLAVAVLSAASGCTLCKPIVGIFTGPVVMLGNSDGDFGSCYCGDGRAIVAVFATLGVIGAGGGLVTGIISDVNALCGNASDPCRNWWDPFKTNRD